MFSEAPCVVRAFDETPHLFVIFVAFVVRVEGIGLWNPGLWSNSKTPVLQTGDSGATPGESTDRKSVPWSSGDDSWPTPRQRWFESIRDHSNSFGPRGAVRSARHPVTVEIAGSNPAGDAQLFGTVRKPAQRRSSNLRDFVGSTPTRVTRSGRVLRGGL